MIVGLLSGALVGLVNGLITVLVGVPSFITTLGMIFLLNGITLNISTASRWRPWAARLLPLLRRLALLRRSTGRSGWSS